MGRHRYTKKGNVDDMYKHTIFSEKKELQLVSQCNQLVSYGYFYGTSEVIDLAQNMARLENKKLPTKSWFHSFFKSRHPDFVAHKKLTIRERTSSSRDHQKKAFYYTELEKAMEEIGVKDKAQNLWILNETEVLLQDDNSSFQILETKKDKIDFVEAGYSPSVTLVNAISAEGETLPPYFVFKGQRAFAEMQANTPEATVFKGDEGGWINSVAFKDFLIKHFMFHNIRRPVMLLYDGNSTHIPFSLIEEAKKENIHLFVLPPNAFSIFSDFKNQLDKNIKRWQELYPDQSLQMEDLPRIFCSTLKTAVTVNVATSIFVQLGIFPFSPKLGVSGTKKDF